MHIDEQENIFNNDQLLGKFEGFIFKPSDTFEQTQENDTLITEAFIKKIDKFINEGDAALRFNEEFCVTYNNAPIAKLLATDNILKPDFTPILDDRIQGIPLARIALHLESWLKRQLNTICDPLDILEKTEDLSPESHDFIKAIRENLGYAQRHKIAALVKKIQPNDRTKLRKAGVRFAQYSVFVRDMLKPSAQKIKLILWALKNNIPLPELPPSGVVTIPFNADFPQDYYDIAGYKVCGEYCVRADMIEKLADAIRPIALKSDANPNGEFEITAQHMSFVGKSGEGFEAILKSLGYNYQEKAVTVISVSKVDIALASSTDADITIQQPETGTDENIEQDNQASSTQGSDVIQDFEAESKVTEATDTQTEVQEAQSADSSDDNITVQENTVIKKMWSWSPAPFKPKSDFRNNYKSQDTQGKPRFNKFPKRPTSTEGSTEKTVDANQNHHSKEFKHKSKDFKSEDNAKHDKKDGFEKKNNFDKDKKDKFKGKSFDKTDNPKRGKDTKENTGAYSKVPSPYVNMPKTHKVANENNPFAALLSLKNKD